MAFAARFGQPKQKHVVAAREDSAIVLADRPAAKVLHETAAQVCKALAADLCPRCSEATLMNKPAGAGCLWPGRSQLEAAGCLRPSCRTAGDNKQCAALVNVLPAKFALACDHAAAAGCASGVAAPAAKGAGPFQGLPRRNTERGAHSEASILCLLPRLHAEQHYLLQPISGSSTVVCSASVLSPESASKGRAKAQAAPTCRKKRLFATQSLTDLLRKEGVDAASLTQDAQGNPSQLSSLLGLDVFDNVEFDSRRPEEWAPPAGQADAPPSPAQVLAVDQEGRGSWEPATVLAWDPSTAKYRVQLDSERAPIASCHEGASDLKHVLLPASLHQSSPPELSAPLCAMWSIRLLSMSSKHLLYNLMVLVF